MSIAPAAALHCVHGIVDASAPIQAVLATVADVERRPRLFAHGAVAALVTGPLPQAPTPSRADLMTHARLLDALAACTAVLPARFGTVLPGADRVRQLLVDNEENLLAGLDAVRGSAQYTVRARHVQQEVLREILDEQPEVHRLRETIVGEGGAARYPEQIRLGELVHAALAAKVAEDTRAMLEALCPHAQAAVPRPVSGVDASFGGAYLVRHARREAFEAAAEELGRRWYGRARVRLLGPLAPYDFVTGKEDGR